MVIGNLCTWAGLVHCRVLIFHWRIPQRMMSLFPKTNSPVSCQGVVLVMLLQRNRTTRMCGVCVCCVKREKERLAHMIIDSQVQTLQGGLAGWRPRRANAVVWVQWQLAVWWRILSCLGEDGLFILYKLWQVTEWGPHRLWQAVCFTQSLLI